MPSYNFATTDVPGATYTSAGGINDAGQIVGVYDDAAGVAHGYIEVGTNFTPINVPGAPSSSVHGISTAGSGQIAGDYKVGSGYNGFVEAGGNFVPIAASNAVQTFATGVDRAGRTVGFYIDSTAHTHGILATSGGITTLDVPGSIITTLFGINNAGQIVGSYADSAGHLHGVIDTAGTFTPVDVPGATVTAATGINGAGDIVGIYNDASGKLHSFVDVAGTLTTVDAPSSVKTEINGINDAGQIVGYYTDVAGNTHGFFATPSGPFLAGTSLEVALLYQAAFGRAPDANGLAGWVQQADLGLTLPQLAATFLASPEFTQRSGTPDIGGFLNTVYNNAFGRAPDAAGAASWAQQANSGVSRAQILADIVDSPEMHQLHGNIAVLPG